MWAGSDRCVAPARQRRVRRGGAAGGACSAQAFAPLFHEIFNEPEQAQVFARLQRLAAAARAEPSSTLAAPHLAGSPP